MNLGSGLVIKTVQHIKKDEITTTVQPQNDEIKTAYKIHKETCEIDWTKSIDIIYNRIRGLSPYPASWTTLQNGNDTYAIKIYEVTKELASHSYEVGSIISSKKEIKIAVKNGYLLLKVIQLPGKRKMEISALLNGFKFEKDAKVS